MIWTMQISEDEISATQQVKMHTLYSAKIKLQKLIKRQNSSIYSILYKFAVLTGLFVFAQYRRFKIIMYWAIDIVKNKNLIFAYKTF